MLFRIVVGLAALTACIAAAQPETFAPTVLPAMATAKLVESLAAARGHVRHAWRDTPPKNPDGTMNAYIEIARGDRQKWELDMRANEARDRSGDPGERWRLSRQLRLRPADGVLRRRPVRRAGARTSDRPAARRFAASSSG